MGKLSENGKKVAENRYFMDDEDWDGCASRVGTVVAGAENSNSLKYSDKFSEMIYNMDFLPGGRILRNAGRPRGSMFNCYHLPIGDSREEIGQFYKDSLILWGEGGGIGVNASSLRPKGADIKGVGGKSSGPVSFLRASDSIAETVESGGSRRAAALALMHVAHPDIMRFIDAKLKHGELSHYNISVAVSEDFLAAVEADIDWEFKFSQKAYGKIRARYIWDKIIENMIKCAEPGLLNWDNLTKNNSYYYDPVMGCNPSLRKGTKVLTYKGVFSIEDLQDCDFEVPNINHGYSKAKCFLSGRGKNLYKVKLRGNHEYYATAEHKWPVVKKDRWNYDETDFIKKRTDELCVGDYLPQPNIKYDLGYGYDGTFQDGFLIGWNIGDGWISNNDRPDQIGFIVSEHDQKYDIHNILTSSLRDLGWSGTFRDVGTNKETNVQNKKVRSFFERFGVTKKTFGIPKSIWSTASEDFRKGFIDGLFSSDASIDVNSKRIVLTSSHEKLVYDVSDLLGFYGIQSLIEHSTHKGIFPNGKTYDKIYHRYTLKISTQRSILHFFELFKLTHLDKQNRIKKIVDAIEITALKHAIQIISVEKTGLYEDVWDVSVFDKIHCFELPHCVTGNCGEAILAPYDVCDLGSLVLPNFITGTINTNWKKLEEVIKLSVRFLDDVIDVNKYVLKEIDIKAHNSRRIGLGVMGLAEYLFAKRLRYGSDKAIVEIDRLMKFIRDTVYEALIELSDEKGAFPKFDPVAYGKSSFVRKLPASLRMKVKEHGVRCVTGLAIAPTGTISLLADVTSGIEPLFRKAYMRHDRVGDRMYVHSIYKEFINNGKEIEDWYVDTDDLKPEDHFEVQSIVQRYVDGAVSKTINLPAGTTAEELSKFALEYIRDLKGVTVYVDGSREGQILNKVAEEQVRQYLNDSKELVSAGEESVKCASGSCEL